MLPPCPFTDQAAPKQVAARRGSSLLETLVAMAILGLVLSAAVSALGLGAGLMGRSRRHADAERVAATHMEALLRMRSVPASGTERFARDGRIAADGVHRSQWHLIENRPIAGGARLEVIVDEGTPHAARLITYLLRARGP